MKKIYNDDTFLARWIENDLSLEESEQFQKSEAYHQFNKINKASQFLKAPDYNKSDAFQKIIKNTYQKKESKKVIKLIPKWVYSAVASVALLFSFFYFNNTTSNFSTEYGELISVKLPDNSIVHLSPNSHLEFNKKKWNKNRNLFLTGEAYFEVKKGKSFTVNTSEGNIVVLGTKFTVNTSKNFLEVQCYEGKVKVNSNNDDESFLTKGKAFRAYANKSESWNFSKEAPSWLNGESNFNNMPLSQVIISLEKNYNLKFNTNNINLDKRFTGTFTHNNVNIALKTVFAPLKISFKLAKNNSVTLISS
ncbi:hypothetical protein CXF68_17185 [Tenacibaculum sp. Bg11-29]|uniref:FecR family protein n=1 Tax=Tenacibaculum sp. Bg11-29 TaxID=2058306 RepID=UPI000C3342C4|nr:FecR family protein [Tenacibaculum sp. Bg11-29]PKH52322.1 hypothetical protein CXF68_17185 [Tenacibaculum sp. Bg11-29]